MISDFRAYSSAHLRSDEIVASRSVLGSLIILLQHGARTSLLDWTESPWVAAYFACASNFEEPGGLWCALQVNWEMLRIQPPDSVVDTLLHETDISSWSDIVRSDGEWMLPFRPQHYTPRMAAQQALYTICNPIDMDHGNIMLRHIERGDRALIVIRPEIKIAALSLLRSMNIHPGTLFPGLDGLCRKLGEDAELRFR